MIALLLVGGAFLAPDWTETRIVLPKEGVGLLLRDLTGDGALDLVRADDEGLSVFPLGANRSYPDEPATRLAWPRGRIGWEVADIDGDGAHEVLLLDERGVHVHRIGDSGVLDDGRLLLPEAAQLPMGVHRVHLVRDVNGDGQSDLILPGSGSHRIFLAAEEGFAAPIEVAFELRSNLQTGDPTRLDSSFGQQVRVPWFRIEDVDGDGRQDLVSETRSRIAFHLAKPQLTAQPTWVLDLDALREELPKRSGIDFDNLLAGLDQRLAWQVAELDGKAPSDLVLLLGSKIRVYLGGALSGPVGAPSQVLKSSGNVLLIFLRQAQGDALPDLQILRAERISVSRVLRSLIVASDLDFDIFTYRNEGGALSRRPTRRNRVTLELPRLLDFMDEGDGSLMVELEEQFDLPTRRLPRVPGQPAAGDDIIDVHGTDLVVFEGCAPDPVFLESLDDAEAIEPGRLIEGLFLEDFDRRDDGATHTLDVGDVESLDFAPAALLRRAGEGKPAMLRHALGVEPREVENLIPRDLDGDGRSDVIVVGETAEKWVVQFLVRT